jgi:hypothetical protein
MPMSRSSVNSLELADEITRTRDLDNHVFAASALFDA